jgi:hypothetical protein
VEEALIHPFFDEIKNLNDSQEEILKINVPSEIFETNK